MTPILVKGPRDIQVLGLLSDHFVSTIEYASRICYAATDLMTEDSWYKYIKARVNSGHESVTEHNMISVIVFGERSESVDGEISDLNRVMNESNTLLHFVSDDEFMVDKTRQFTFSISGNIKMWRDFFKYLYSEKEYNIIFKLIAKFFRAVNYTPAQNPDEGLDELFSSDIKYIYETNPFDSSVSIMGDLSRTNYICKDMERCKRMVPVGDDRINLSVLNIDNPSDSITFNPGIKEYLGEWQTIVVNFIRKHLKDLSSVTFEITMPRIITQQESRHRVNSISQASQRYINEGESPKAHTFYTPEKVDGSKEYELSVGEKNFSLSYDEFNELSRKLYIALFNDEIPKETARFVLTNSVYSTMVVTKPFYTLDHYFKERTSNAAQYEIRLPAIALKDYINNYFRINYLKEYGVPSIFN